MFSETFAGGTVRMVREATKHLPHPPAIYGHNAGIGVKTRGGIWREVIDLLARLDGIDIRQTAPVRPGPPFIRPYGAEWEASEEVLSRELPGIRPTMIARAGGLDQGNIILNLADAERRGLAANVLFLAGSAINSDQECRGPARSASWAPRPCCRRWRCIARASWPTCRSTSTAPRWRPSRGEETDRADGSLATTISGDRFMNQSTRRSRSSKSPGAAKSGWPTPTSTPSRSSRSSGNPFQPAIPRPQARAHLCRCGRAANGVGKRSRGRWSR